MFYMVFSLIAVLIFCITLSLIVGKEIKRLMVDNRTQRTIISKQRGEIAMLNFKITALKQLETGELTN